MQRAVLGMGRMGQALAGRLIKCGHELTIWNRSPHKAPDLVERGATEARSVADALDGAELVLASLSNDDAVRAVAFGDEGVRPNLPGGSGAPRMRPPERPSTWSVPTPRMWTWWRRYSPASLTSTCTTSGPSSSRLPRSP